MAHPKEADEWVTSIEVDHMAYPGVESEPATAADRTIQRPVQCPSCGQYQGSPAHGHPKE